MLYSTEVFMFYSLHCTVKGGSKLEKIRFTFNTNELVILSAL